MNRFHHPSAYRTPKYFCSDWLNEYWDDSIKSGKDDYKFVYVGPAGSWTPLHSYVVGSYSWSANVAGRKRWIFFQPGQEKFLRKNVNLSELVYDVRDVITPSSDVALCDPTLKSVTLFQGETEGKEKFSNTISMVKHLVSEIQY